MRKTLVLVSALTLAGAAWAHNCPNEMKAIDAKIASAKPAKDVLDKVSKLRSEGEALHKAGKHTESMKALGDAKKLLGM
ncbi:hypothetical protein [Ramlibacter sp.]|uniref:hypothetical protein n=1 Tax=Ramlibacter sp. TaxID=1917967 RepID=UPI003D10CE9F